MPIDPLAAVITVVVVVVIVFAIPSRRPLAGAPEPEVPRSRRKPGAALAADEIAELETFRLANALPAVPLRPAPERPVSTDGCRLGGPAWLPDGENWPRDDEGWPLEFLGQLDFAGLPELADFPRQGLLQFFIGGDDLYGADFAAPGLGRARLFWRDRIDGGRLVEPPPLVEEAGNADTGVEYSPFIDHALRRRGVALVPGELELDPLPDSDWRMQQRLQGKLHRAGIDRMLEAWRDGQVRGHKTGGHPAYTQADFRRKAEGDGLDVVLFGLSSDDVLMWGNCGKANFLIPRGALRRRDFSRVVFWWDCC
ncbi:YwqG family protein [Arenimonas composti]|uniref:DUF1963 domain-containing protein n=1 Tax=Arenimonas composti TR7-09 = DSM 18010 TaxID=1121013 RepID=A0A091BBZ8_9GAMM|nr:DUF1963 domain-containing protein [Arenimonas composti]KFN50193.1 hypothetical protein P873_07500 [Arenimonas composti TR7-09 = DSM 18010]